MSCMTCVGRHGAPLENVREPVHTKPQSRIPPRRCKRWAGPRRPCRADRAIGGAVPHVMVPAVPLSIVIHRRQPCQPRWHRPRRGSCCCAGRPWRRCSYARAIWPLWFGDIADVGVDYIDVAGNSSNAGEKYLKLEPVSALSHLNLFFYAAGCRGGCGPCARMTSV